MSVSLDKPMKGDIVNTPEGQGVVVDRDPMFAASAVTLPGQFHQWWSNTELKVVGYSPDTLVWFGPRMVPAFLLRRDKR